MCVEKEDQNEFIENLKDSSLDSVNKSQVKQLPKMTNDLLELCESHYLKHKENGDIRDKYLSSLNLGLLYQI